MQIIILLPIRKHPSNVDIVVENKSFIFTADIRKIDQYVKK